MNTQNKLEIPVNPGGRKSVILDNQTDLDIDENLFEAVFQTVQKNESLPQETDINLLLSNDGLIQKYNRQYLGRNELTDVISFKADLPGFSLLGDIIIDTRVAEKQKENRTLGEELQILFLHGLLHLLDYDHFSAKQEQIMKKKEMEYIKNIKKNTQVIEYNTGDKTTSGR